jgi:hypothetical protein
MTRTMTTVFDATLFTGGLAAHQIALPRMGRIFPPADVFNSGDPAKGPDLVHLRGVVAGLAKQFTDIYIDEIWATGWVPRTVDSPDAPSDQIVLDNWGTIAAAIRAEAPEARLWFCVPGLLGYAAPRIFLEGKWCETYVRRAAETAFAVQRDWRSDPTKETTFHAAVTAGAGGGLVIEHYYVSGAEGTLSWLPPGIEPLAALAECCRLNQKLIAQADLPSIAFVRIVDVNRVPVPADVCQVLAENYPNLAIWEDELGAPPDAPMFGLLRDRHPLRAPARPAQRAPLQR